MKKTFIKFTKLLKANINEMHVVADLNARFRILDSSSTHAIIV